MTFLTQTDSHRPSAFVGLRARVASILSLIAAAYVATREQTARDSRF